MMKKHSLKQSPQKFHKTEEIVVLVPQKKYFPSLQFPSVYRYIPEISLRWPEVRLFLVSFVLGFLLMALTIQGYRLWGAYDSLNALTRETTSLQQQVTKWQAVVKHYPNYRDGYFQLALLERQLGNPKQAQVYLEKVLYLDPNFTLAQSLQ